MKLKDLRDAVALKGTETSLEAIDETSVYNFRHAATQALYEVNALDPVKSTVKIFREEASEAVLDELDGNTEDRVTVGGVTYYRTDEKWYGYKAVSTTGFRASGRVEGDSVVFNLKELGDFLRFSGVPVNMQTKKPYEREDYASANGRIVFDRSLFDTQQDRVNIEYQVAMPTVDSNTPDDFEIPINDELCQLLSNLVAYYVLLEDSPNTAMLLKAKYDEQRTAYLSFSRHSYTAQYFTNGW